MAPAEYRELFGSRAFIRYLIAITLLTWVRDGLITWILSFLHDQELASADGAAWLRPASGMPPPNDAIGLAIFVGGATGGVALGAISDSLFRSARRPPLLIFTLAQAVALGALGPMVEWTGAAWLALSPVGAVVCVWAACFFVLGNYSLLCYGVPTDLGEQRAGMAAGVTRHSTHIVLTSQSHRNHIAITSQSHRNHIATTSQPHRNM